MPSFILIYVIPYFNAGDYQRAIEAGKQAVKLNPTNPDAYFCLGRAYTRTGQIDLAIENLKKAEIYAKSDKDLMYIYNWLGKNYDNKGDLDNALLYYSRSLDLAKKLRDRKGEATMLNNIAGIFHKKGELDKALIYYEESLRLKTDEIDKAPTYNNIANIYSDKGNYEKAIEYLKKALDIEERYGKYHGSGQTMLNLGNAYRNIKDYKNAKFYLEEGLKRVQKVGDKYWEGTGYEYLGHYYKDLGDKKLAREYYNKAFEIFTSIGAQSDALATLSYILTLESETASIYGGIEIGSKGVKAIVLQIQREDKEGFYNVEEKFRRTINTGIITGVKETGVFSEDAIKETAQVIKELFDIIKNQYKVDEKNIFIAGSSALVNVKNRDELSKKVRELTGKDIYFITKEEEVYYNVIGAVPPKYQSKAIVVDIGSGNTKIGYIEGSDKNTRTVSIEIPYGTVSFTDMIQKTAKSKREWFQVAENLVQKEVVSFLQRESQRKPALKNRSPVFMLGGIVWAMVTLLYPEKQDAFVKITQADIERFYREIKESPEKFLNPDLSKIKDARQERLGRKADTGGKGYLQSGKSSCWGISFKGDSEFSSHER